MRARAIFALFLLATSCRLFHPARYRIVIDLEPSIRALGSDDLAESSAAEDAIVGLHALALPALDAALDHEPPAVRAEIVSVLNLMDVPGTIPLLMKAAGDRVEDVRLEALQVLSAQTSDSRVRALIEAALEDPSPKVQVNAARMCAAICTSPPALARLVDIAISDRNFPSSLWARASLAAIMQRKDATASEARAAIERVALPRLQGDGSLDERARAALLVADIGNPAAQGTLAAAAREAPDIQLRARAVYALGAAGNSSTVQTLAGLLRGSDSELVPYVCNTLGGMAARGVADADRTRKTYCSARPPAPVLSPP
jgi:HEAT repeat protein